MAKDSKPLFQYTSHVLTRSQVAQPELLLDILVATAVKESWIILLISLHIAILFGLILLASGFGIFSAFNFLVIHLAMVSLSSIILIYLIRKPETHLVATRRNTLWLLVIADALIALGWGISIMLLFSRSDFTQFNTLAVILLAAGISTAALSAKILRVLVTGRSLVFLPTIAFLLYQQPPDWLLYTMSLGLSFAVALGVGYAVHIQLLREASLVVEVNEARAQTVKEAAFREHFLQSITHDLRQPLTSLGLFSRALRRRYPETSDYPEVSSIEYCLSSANQVLENVTQLAWVTDKIPSPQLQAVSLDRVLSPLVSSYQPQALEKGIELRYVKTSLWVHSEANYIERAIRNLLDNAIEQTQQGGVLVGVRRRTSISRAEIQVVDTGPGISAVDKAAVFKEYHRLQSDTDNSRGHLGLGLSIVSRIAAALNGTISLTSALGSGSCFSLKLPLVDENNDAAHATYAVSTENQKTVLIVDDNQEYAEFLAGIIASLGFSPITKTTNTEIRSLLDGSIAGIDFYIIDYHLGDSVSGPEIIQRIKANIPGALISHQTVAHIIAELPDTNCIFISKESSKDTLIATFKEHFQR